MEKMPRGKKIKSEPINFYEEETIKAKKSTKKSDMNTLEKNKELSKTADTKNEKEKIKNSSKSKGKEEEEKEVSKTQEKKNKQGTLDKFNIKISEKSTTQKINDFNGVMIEMPDDSKLKIISWNVNGMRSFKGKGTLDQLIKDENPDIICFNETKIDEEKLLSEKINLLHSDKYGSFWNCCKVKKGYSGVAIFTKYKPLSVIYDIGEDVHDQEGRVITLEFSNFFVVCVYVPNAGDGLKRLDYRVNQWDKSFQKFLLNLSSKKNLILTGDLNVAHREIDVYNPKGFIRHAGFTIEERESFSKFLVEGFIDTFRYFYPDLVKYSFFSALGGQKAISENRGWRLDYFVVNNSAIENVEDSDILVDYKGSDHRPVKLVYNNTKLKI